MPVFRSCRNPDNIPFSYLLDWTSPLLNPADSRSHDQCLAEWVSMPNGPSTKFESHARADCARWIVGVEERLNMHGAGKVCRCSLGDSLRTASRDLDRVQVLE